MITVALGQIVWGVAYRWISLTNGDNGIIITGRPNPLGLSLATPARFYWATLIVFVVAVVSMAIFVASPFGASVRGTRDQPRRMNALGYHVWMIRFLAFLFSAFWSGVAGLLYLYYNQFVSPQAVALTASAEALLMVIAGGSATLLGPIAGAGLVVVMKNVEPGERRLIIGPNGAGKTTLFNLITGELRPDGGSVTLFDRDITGVASRRRTHLGIARTYQIITLFQGETLLRNITLSLLGLSPLRWNPFVRLGKRDGLVAEARATLARVGLEHLADRPLAQTSYGERRRAEIAMALALHEIDAFYGDSHVLHRVSLRLGEGRLLGLLGRNGAGKSTSMNVTVGLLPPRHGAVTVFGSPVTGRTPEAIAAQGVALVPQGRRVFRSLTVRENLAVAGRKPRGRLPMLWTLETVFALFPTLRERHQQIAGSLSGGEQQMLA